MKYLKLFENNNKNIHVKSFTQDEFHKEIYDYEKYDVKDPSMFDRIRFFSWDQDFGWSYGDNNFHFVVLFDNDKVIGVCKIGHYSGSERGDEPNYMSISYCSIDRRYRGKGYLNLMIEELMKLCKRKGFDLGSSSWTIAGNTALRPTIKKWAKKYGVNFLDHDRFHDREWMYNADMVSVEEMDAEERKEYDELRNYKPPEGFFKKMMYNTGKYEIYSTQTKGGFDKEKVDKIYKDIDNNNYIFRSNDGKIAGYIHNGKYYITEGHHRMLAALRYWKRRGDYLPVDKLIKLGNFEEKKVDTKHKFPSKLMEDAHFDNHPKPDWFYVVLRGSGKSRGYQHNKLQVWESLSKMKFEGLRGVSDNTGIVKSWFDVRSFMLVMDAKETMNINKMHPVYYYNPDQLVSNNFEILIRVLQNEDRDLEYSITGTITKVFQNINSISDYGKKWKGTIGRRKQARIQGTWHREGTREYMRKIMSAMQSNDFMYKMDDYIYDRIKDGFTVKNVGHFAKLIGEGIEHYREYFNENRYYGKGETNLQYLVRHYDEYGTKFIEKVLRWAIGVTGKIYDKHEGEWIMKKDHTGQSELNVPENSHLFIKISPSRDDEEAYRNWFKQQKKDKKKYGYDDAYSGSAGITMEEAKEMIDLYHLDDIYNIHFVRNYAYAGHLLKTKFNNK